MVKEQLAALYALQQQDSALAVLQREYAALDKGQAEQATFEAARAAHIDADSKLHATTATLRDTELEQKTVETKRIDEEKKLYGGKVRAAKDLQALQEEVEMLGRQRGRLDEKILVLMADLEAQRRLEAETKQALAAAKSAYKVKLDLFKVQEERIKAQFRVIAAQRTEAAKAIPPDLLKRYETLRTLKGGVAIAAVVEGNACGGCRMALPSNFVRSVHEGTTIGICQNCGRMVYELPKT